jgi:hypothetical protein
MDEDIITRIYCDVDDFCKAHSLPGEKKGAWFPASRLSLSEVMNIILLFQMVLPALRPHTPERIFPGSGQLQPVRGTDPLCLLPLLVYTQLFRLGKSRGVVLSIPRPLKCAITGVSTATKGRKLYAARGKSSTGWFYGFKLRLIINDCGEICSFCLTPAMWMTGMRILLTVCAVN